MATAVGQASEITLRGSVAIVTEFFGFAVNSILFQRGIYPPESFESRKKYGLGMMVTSDAGLTQYLDNVLRQIQFWLDSGKLQRLVLVVSSIADRETLERWTFNIQADAPPAPGILCVACSLPYIHATRFSFSSEFFPILKFSSTIFRHEIIYPPGLTRPRPRRKSTPRSRPSSARSRRP